MSTHTIFAVIEVFFTFPGLAEGDHETAHPSFEITFDYERGYTPGTPHGEYGPIDPPVGPQISFREAKLIKDDGLNPNVKQVQEWAEEWLNDKGYDYACDCAETDLRAMRQAIRAMRHAQ